MSPLMKQRLAIFRANKRSLWSLRLFLILFVISLFAELVANSKPLLISYEDSLYTPFLKTYPETTFGGDFLTEADYRDPYITDIIQEKGWILWPPIPFSYDTFDQDLDQPAPSAPDTRHILGTDDQGRDVLARILYGFRISVLFGLSLTILSSIIGFLAGAVQGYFGGLIDLGLQRFIEIWSGLPVLYLLIILSSIVVPGFWWLLLTMLLFSWMSLVAVVRAECLKARRMEYVQAAKALGLSNWHIIKKHVLPNASVAAITFMPFILNGSIVTLTSLDFLGFGLPPGSPSLGELVAQGKGNLHAPWLGISAFMSLAILLSLLIFIGEGVREAFDPRR